MSLVDKIVGAYNLDPKIAEDLVNKYSKASAPEATSDETVMRAIGQQKRAGNLGTSQLHVLRETITSLDDLHSKRDTQIQEALKAGARVKDVCTVTGLSRARIEQIRNDTT